jgi:hypothetical protein
MGKTVPCLWPDSTIVCMATGPSLTQADCDYVRELGVPTIAINDAHRLAPWANVLYSNDRMWWRKYKGVPSFTGLRYGVGSALGKRNPILECPHVVILRNSGYGGLDRSPDGLRTARNSGYGAINLAVHLGAKRVVLLGYNMGWVRGKAHFFGNHPPTLSQHEYLYPNFRKSFELLVEPLRAAGVVVWNCTEPTSMNAFPVAKLRDVLPMPMAVAS